MYLKQPDSYYIEIATILCAIFEIPDSEKLAIIEVKCPREKVIKKTSYKVHGRMRHYSTPVNKYQQQLNTAKDILYLYLWNRKIKPPTGNHRRMLLSRISEYQEAILADENLKLKNDVFVSHANKVAVKTLVKRISIEEDFI